jgi:hypothetical protein
LGIAETFVSVKVTVAGVVPVAPAVTVYGPPIVPFAVAVTLARPLAAIVAGLPVSVADAPLPAGETVNVTCPPCTGSLWVLETPTTSGCPNTALTAPDCASPLTFARVNPWLSKAPISQCAPWDDREMPR